MKAVPAFLEELGYRIDEGRIDDRSEDEQIRIRCENLTARQRLEMHRQLYALRQRGNGSGRHDHTLHTSNRRFDILPLKSSHACVPCGDPGHSE
jgi:hypothetical protein